METESAYTSLMPPHADRFEDETDTSSLSDYDSEWTQISGTEDDSDFPPFTAASDRPLSPADTIDGSVDEDIWEGFAEGIRRHSSESSDETRSTGVDATDEAPEQDAQSLNTSIATCIDEDMRVNDALNCSVMGTLRASRVRSAASSLHASLTESQSKLRLSFPDPLFSRTDERDSEPDPRAGASTPTSTTDEHCENLTIEEAFSSFADIEAPSTLDVSEIADEDTSTAAIPSSASCMLSLVLYGSASLSKWHIAERILMLALQYDGEVPFLVEEGITRRYYFRSSRAFTATSEQSFFVHVVDRTSSTFDTIFTDVSYEVPSLAIILLPSRLPTVLPRHTCYLPLISPPSLDFGTAIPFISSAFSEQVMSDSAQYALERLDLPNENLIMLDSRRPNAIVDVASLDSLDRETLVHAFSALFSGETVAHRTNEREQLFLNKWYTLAFVAAAIIAITVGGFRINSKLSSATVAVNTKEAQLSVNFTHSITNANSGAVLSISTSHHDLAVFHATLESPVTPTAKGFAQTSLVSTHDTFRASSHSPTDFIFNEEPIEAETSSTSASSSLTSCCSKSLPWADRIVSSLAGYNPSDLMVRPVTAVRISEKDATPQDALLTVAPAERRVAGSGKNSEQSPSARVVHDSLSLVSNTSKALVQVVGREMLVLFEAIDKLLLALGRQVDNAKARVGLAQSNAQDELSFRNTRAKENAKMIRRAGEHMFKLAGERLRSGKEEAIKVMGKACEGVKTVRRTKSGQSRRMRRNKAPQSERVATHVQAKDREEIEEGPYDESYNEKLGRKAKRLRRRMRRTRLNSDGERRGAEEDHESGGIFGAVMGVVF